MTISLRFLICTATAITIWSAIELVRACRGPGA